MKKILAILSILALLLGCAALAEDRVVVNCEEWVSLRAEPSTSAKRLAKVPLDSVVTDCVPGSNGFTYCEYLGQAGYILTEYLEAVPGDVSNAFDEDDGGDGSEVALDAEAAGVRIRAVRDYDGDNETMTLTATDAGSGETLWTRTLSGIATELTATAAFLGGTEAEPVLILGQSEIGVSACDLRTGETLWTVSREDTALSAGLCYALAADGTMYLGGFYGPDPVAIDGKGSVLWRADAQDDDTYWLYELKILDDVLAAHYDHLIDEDAGWVYYDLATGEKLGIERE